MKQKTFLLLTFVLLVCVFVSGWMWRGQAAARDTWEYKVVNTTLDRNYYGERTLNELGAQGWELTGVAAWNNEGNSPITVLYFKRAK